MLNIGADIRINDTIKKFPLRNLGLLAIVGGDML